MRTCKKCNLEKSELDYYKDTTRPDGLNTWCKTCHAKYTKDSQQAKKLYLWEVKSVPCADCGNSYHPVAMDLHHLDPKIKEFNFNARRSLQKIKAEVDKCVVLCAVCHRLRHL